MAPEMSKPQTAEGYEIVARYHLEDDANAAAETLVLRGLGAIVETRTDHEAAFTLVAVSGDADRARALLGLPAVEDDEPLRPPSKSNLFWVGAIFIAAMVILPALAFFVSFKLSGG
jgi:hypothetical protein